ncbi:hypothetical protein HWV62_29541 [Athelia sp. TMB]|nr:hypothetical protein HWV62_29541 [Athelia sp. TMB]
MPDVYDQDKVTEVMRILLGEHGVNLSGVKSNLYTAIGLDSKHASGIQSTSRTHKGTKVWKNTALLKDTEIKQLKDSYFAGLTAAKATVSDKAKEKESAAANKPKKPVLKKKAAEADPFDSDEDEATGPSTSSRKAVAGTKRPKASRGADEEEEERPKKKGAS